MLARISPTLDNYWRHGTLLPFFEVLTCGCPKGRGGFSPGKAVKFGRGPAAVTGYKFRITSLCPRHGKTREEDDPEARISVCRLVAPEESSP